VNPVPTVTVVSSMARLSIFVESLTFNLNSNFNRKRRRSGIRRNVIRHNGRTPR